MTNRQEGITSQPDHSEHRYPSCLYFKEKVDLSEAPALLISDSHVGRRDFSMPRTFFLARRDFGEKVLAVESFSDRKLHSEADALLFKCDTAT